MRGTKQATGRYLGCVSWELLGYGTIAREAISNLFRLCKAKDSCLEISIGNHSARIAPRWELGGVLGILISRLCQAKGFHTSC